MHVSFRAEVIEQANVIIVGGGGGASFRAETERRPSLHQSRQTGSEAAARRRGDVEPPERSFVSEQRNAIVTLEFLEFMR